MTQLLVSVRSAVEATAALLGGAAWVDVKEPANGPLGAPTGTQIDLVRRVVGDRAPLSVALGELRDKPAEELLSLRDGVSFAKVGLAGCEEHDGWREDWIEWMKRLPAGVAPVAVVYADFPSAGAPSPRSVVELARQCACQVLLCDTFDKSRGNLFDHFSDRELGELLDMAREAGMMIALAGSLTPALLPQAIRLEPDIIAVRGAACRGGRDGQIDAALVRQLVLQLSTPRATSCANSSICILDSL